MGSSFFSLSHRRGIIGLCVILILCALGVVLLTRREGGEAVTMRQRLQNVKSKATRYFAQPERKVETFPFDPNTADSTTFLRLGLTPSMVRNIYKYRAMGYTYNEVEDFSRVYGMTNEMWERLEPCVRIDERFRLVTPKAHERRTWRSDTTETERTVVPRDTTRYPIKLTAGQTVNVNCGDTAMLKKVPGVGSYFAKKITEYGHRLGGYVSLEQLEDIDGIPEGIGKYMTLGNDSIRRIDVNHCTKNVLFRHPYINRLQAQSILEYRRYEGRIKGVEDLLKLPDFSEADVRRLAPYLEFK